MASPSQALLTDGWTNRRQLSSPVQRENIISTSFTLHSNRILSWSNYPFYFWFNLFWKEKKFYCQHSCVLERDHISLTITLSPSWLYGSRCLSRYYSWANTWRLRRRGWLHRGSWWPPSGTTPWSSTTTASPPSFHSPAERTRRWSHHSFWQVQGQGLQCLQSAGLWRAGNHKRIEPNLHSLSS